MSCKTGRKREHIHPIKIITVTQKNYKDEFESYLIIKMGEKYSMIEINVNVHMHGLAGESRLVCRNGKLFPRSNELKLGIGKE